MIRRRTGRLALAALLLLAASWLHMAPAATPIARAAELPAWTGSLNLYRSGVFTTQSSWLYCTAADIQIIRNMVEGTTSHSSAEQATYFDWMRTKNRYDIPLSAGIDPAGWAAGMQHFVDGRYVLVSSRSFAGTVSTAVTRMRRTGLPVALAVAHGNHGWVLNGFTATADPAATADFEITSVFVTGPLWGLQNSSAGYDMRPNTELTLDQLETYFTRWHYDPMPMIWDGSFVSIQPRADEEGGPSPPPNPTAPPPPKATPKPTPRPTPRPTPQPTLATAPEPTPTPTPPPAPTASPTRGPIAAATSIATAAPSDRPVPTTSTPPASYPQGSGNLGVPGLWVVLLAVLVIALVRRYRAR